MVDESLALMQIYIIREKFLALNIIEVSQILADTYFIYTFGSMQIYKPFHFHFLVQFLFFATLTYPSLNRYYLVQGVYVKFLFIGSVDKQLLYPDISEALDQIDDAWHDKENNADLTIDFDQLHQQTVQTEPAVYSHHSPEKDTYKAVVVGNELEVLKNQVKGASQ